MLRNSRKEHLPVEAVTLLEAAYVRHCTFHLNLAWSVCMSEVLLQRPL